MIAAWVLAIAGLASAPSRDPDVVAGEAAYREERWDDASAAFAAAYRRTGDPIFLYTRAQVERRAGRCRKAIELYQQFLATSPPAEAGAAAERHLEACRASLPAPAPIEPTSSDAPTASPPADRDRAPRHWSRDPAAAVLAGTGAVAIVTGVALVATAYRRVDRAPEAADDRSYGDRLAGARRLEIAGATVIPIGGLLLVGAVIRWAILAKRDRSPRATLSMSWGRGGAVGLQLQGRIGARWMRARR